MFKKVASYSLGLYVVTMIAAVIRVLTKSVIAKMLDQQAMGAYTFFTSMQDVGTSVLAFGMNRTIAKQVAANKAEGNDYGQVVAAILLLLSVLSGVLTGIAILLRDQLEWTWVLILIGTGPFTIFTIARSVLRGQFERNRELIATFLNIAIQAIGVILMTVLVADYRSPVIGLVITNIVTVIVTMLYFIYQQPAYWKLSRLIRCYRSPEFRHLINFAMPLWITEILVVINYQFDFFVVEGKLGYSALAEYGAAFTFVGLLTQPLIVLSQMFVVTFASGFYTDVEQYRTVSSLNLIFISTLGLIITAFSFLLTPLIFTEEYTLTPLLVAILSVAYVFKSVEVFSTALTIAQDYPQANRNATLWNTFLYIPIALIFVIYFGVVGAAWSNTLSWGIYAVIHALYMRRRLPKHSTYALYQMLLGTTLYIGIIGITWYLNSVWSVLVTIPLYLILGHLLHLWDLTQIPNLVYRLLPKQLSSKAIISGE